MNPTARLAATAAAALVAAACGGNSECRPVPCPLGGVVVSVVDRSTGAAISGASVSISGPACTPDSCACIAPAAGASAGPADAVQAPQAFCRVPDGSFVVTAQAPGYTAGQAPAAVTRAGTPPCDFCQSTAAVTISLAP